MRLLLVEDNARLRELLGESLRQAGYSVDAVGEAADFRSAAAEVQYDLYIVDLGLPDIDGLELIRSLRADHDKTPILVVTARGTVGDRVQGLDLGADDYLVKPFHQDELIARVRALLRRPAAIAVPEITQGRVVLREESGEALVDGERLDLRPKEFQLLQTLMRQPGQTLSKAAIEESLGALGRETTPNAVEVLVSRLRRALATADTGLEIETVRGFGYRLKVTLP
jgi:DNA-binding response OmpR family regulator